MMSLLFVSPTPICFLLEAGVGGGGGGEGGKGPDNAHMLTVGGDSNRTLLPYTIRINLRNAHCLNIALTESRSGEIAIIMTT